MCSFFIETSGIIIPNPESHNNGVNNMKELYWMDQSPNLV